LLYAVYAIDFFTVLAAKAVGEEGTRELVAGRVGRVGRVVVVVQARQARRHAGRHWQAQAGAGTHRQDLR